MGNRYPHSNERPHPDPLPEGEGAKSPSPQPSPKGRGSNSTLSQTSTIQSPRPEGEVRHSSPLPLGEDLGEGNVKSPLPLGEGKGEGAPAHMIELAKNLRKNQTNAEKFIWQLLRNRQVANAKFRRQQPIEGFIADFYCHEHQLVIELDGGQHFTEDGMKNDALRTQRLNQLGITVLRFDNRQVFLETEGVLEVIFNAVNAPHSSERPHPNPLPEGEGVKSPSPQPSPKGRGGNSTLSQTSTIQSPLPLGEGKGEGALIRQNLEGLGYGE